MPLSHLFPLTGFVIIASGTSMLGFQPLGFWFALTLVLALLTGTLGVAFWH